MSCLPVCLCCERAAIMTRIAAAAAAAAAAAVAVSAPGGSLVASFAARMYTTVMFDDYLLVITPEYLFCSQAMYRKCSSPV